MDRKENREVGYLICHNILQVKKTQGNRVTSESGHWDKLLPFYLFHSKTSGDKILQACLAITSI